ncbi:MAG: YceI family protein [Pseudomonadota bacterium]
MMPLNITKTLVTTLALSTFALGAHAETWTFDSSNSRISFGSVKQGDIGESHGLSGIKGTVSADGAVTATIDLSTVDTDIDVRNERMIKHVFKNAPDAKLTATLDMDALKAMAPGDTTTILVEGALEFLGEEIPLDVDMFVMRATGDKVVAVSDGMVYLSTEELGINAGIDMLKEIAGLDSITRATPVSIRFVFNAKDGAS